MTDGDLIQKVIQLDVARAQLARLKTEADAAAAAVIAELRRRGSGRFEFADKAAVLTRSESLEVSVDEFRAACAAAHVDAGKMAEAISERVAIAKARALLGEDTLRAAGSVKRGDWAVRVVSAGRKKAGQ